MKITVLTVGKIKEKYFTDAIAEYRKRLSRYCTLEVIEVVDEKTPESASDAEERMIREKEGERILGKLKQDAYIIALAINGELVSSEFLAERMEQLFVRRVSHIIFIIGGSLGLCEKVMQVADWKLSFSKMTFPHQLMRVILLEQVYRGFRIIRKEPYHK